MAGFNGYGSGGLIMANPYDDQTAPFLVLANAEKRFSLWPLFVPIPQGWSVTFGPASRDDVLAWIAAAVPSLVSWPSETCGR
jgi:MbtH protein